MQFEVETFDVAGLVLIKPRIFGDARGYFFESYSKKDLLNAGIHADFVQDNQSYSSKGILRGLHFQKKPYAQSKLVRVSQGKVFDVAVDIRASSPTFGQYIGVELSDQNHAIFYIPKGFAHGYLVLSETAIFQYKCDDYYAPAAEDGLQYNDPDISIQWPVIDVPIRVSDKDAVLPRLKDLQIAF